MIDRVRGTVRRRILLNYRVHPDIARRQLPPGFEPKLVGGYALGGVCLIRLEHERPFPAPRVMGLSSENVAHRFAAVRVDERGVRRDCVYIPRRHSSSGLMRALGGRAFPGEPGRAKFGIHEDDTSIDIMRCSWRPLAGRSCLLLWTSSGRRTSRTPRSFPMAPWRSIARCS